MGDMAGAAAQTQGCSGLSRDVGTCQGGGSGGKEENCGILEGKESLRELLGVGWYWVGVCRSRYPELRVFLGLCELLKGKKHVSSWDAQGRLLPGFRDFV